MGSPVSTASLTLVVPATTRPSTGIVSPGRTRTRSPSATFSTSQACSAPSPLTTRACVGVISTSRSMPARTRATVSCSSRPPSCMMRATSPAAKCSPTTIEAMRASDTSRSALMSRSYTTASVASHTMGTPHSTMASQAESTGTLPALMKLTTSATADAMMHATSFLTPPHSSAASRRSFTTCSLSIQTF